MRKFLVLSFLCCALSENLFAQLLVQSNGNVAIKPTTDPVVSDFTINHTGASNTCSYIFTDNPNKNIGLRVSKRNANTPSNYSNYGLYIDAISTYDSFYKTYGIYTHARREYEGSATGASYGVYAVAGNSGNGLNFGVFGCMSGESDGAGIYGTVYNWENGMYLSERFAGLFHGNLKTTDAMYATVYNTPSDYRFKENIESVGVESTDGLLKLNVVKYNLKQFSVETGDTATVHEYYYTDDSKILERKHYGLIAQELQQIYPDLVYEGKDGYLSVNYMEIIPILIKKIQELELKVEKLDNAPSKAAMRNAVTTTVSDIESLPILYQNNPNPFTENTTIKCVIPNSVRSALLYIYDMNGHQIDSMTISDRDNVTITIEGSRLDAGMYMYSLVTDGNLVDTKRMILTK